MKEKVYKDVRSRLAHLSIMRFILFLILRSMYDLKIKKIKINSKKKKSEVLFNTTSPFHIILTSTKILTFCKGLG